MPNVSHASAGGCVVICLVLMITSMVSVTSFPLNDRLLEKVDMPDDSSSSSSSLSSTSSNQYTSLARQLRHFRLRHEHRRYNRAKEALMYLRKYGYLDKELTETNVRLALKSFQEVAGVKASGELDRRTIEGMRMPRCGNTDVKPTISPKRLRRRFAQMSKWLNKMDDQDVLRLQWYIDKYTTDIPRDRIKEVVKGAFKLWSDQVSKVLPSMRTVKLQFDEASANSAADISIMWAEGEHGDAYPFDGPGNSTNILAHTFYPNYQETGSLNGDIHFDDYEKWVLDDSSEEGVHFPYVLVHEIGHAVGLGHSKRQKAVMNPIYKQTPLNQINLDIDDICAINWNYIGPTNTCLFVWLMVELWPRAKESNTTHGVVSVVNTSSSDPSGYYSHKIGEQVIDGRVNRSLTNVLLKNASVPKCSPDNNVQSVYESMLMNKLEFPEESARRYGPVVCDFFDGLRRTLGKPDDDGSTTADDVPSTDSDWENSAGGAQPLVHSYSSSPYAETQFLEFHRYVSDSEEEEDDDSASADDDRQRPAAAAIDGLAADRVKLSRDFFDERFFDRLLALFNSNHWRTSGQIKRS